MMMMIAGSVNCLNQTPSTKPLERGFGSKASWWLWWIFVFVFWKTSWRGEYLIVCVCVCLCMFGVCVCVVCVCVCVCVRTGQAVANPAHNSLLYEPLHSIPPSQYRSSTQTHFVPWQHTAYCSSCMHSYVSSTVQQKHTVCVLFIADSYCSVYSVMATVRILLFGLL